MCRNSIVLILAIPFTREHCGGVLLDSLMSIICQRYGPHGEKCQHDVPPMGTARLVFSSYSTNLPIQ